MVVQRAKVPAGGSAPKAEFAVPQTPVKVTAQPAVQVGQSLPQCSVELARNAKGQASWTIKLYCEPEYVAKCVDAVVAEDARLRNMGSSFHGQGT